MIEEIYDAVIVGGGPSGATAACDLANAGRKVLLLDRAGRIKPCGGAVPPRLLADFDVPESLLVARARSARMIAPSNRTVDMPVGEIGFVGMVDRDVFDEWLRERAVSAGAQREQGRFERLERDEDGRRVVVYAARGNGLAPEGPMDAHGERIYFLRLPGGLQMSFQSAWPSPAAPPR